MDAKPIIEFMAEAQGAQGLDPSGEKKMAFASNLAAINAAKQFVKAAGFNANQFKEFFKIEKINGEWHSLQTQAFPEARDPALSLADDREGAWAFPKAGEAPAIALTSSQAESAGYEESGDEFFAEQQAEAERKANAAASEQALPNGKVWIHVSSVVKPTKFVWQVADEMIAAAREAGKPEPTRKQVQDECIRRGVASGTARTQYQAWKTARDNARANEQRAAELSAKFNAK